MAKIAIIAAMSREIALLKDMLEELSHWSCGPFQAWGGRYRQHDILVLQSGIGKVCAAVGVVEIIRNFSPDVIINTGAAGGIDGELAVMDMVVVSKAAYHDVYCGGAEGQVQGFPMFFDMDAGWVSKAAAAGAEVVCAASGDRFVTTAAEAEAVRRVVPSARIVDMETAAIAQVCYLYKVPFLSLRLISDTPGSVSDHAAQYEDFWAAAGEHSFEILQKLL